MKYQTLGWQHILIKVPSDWHLVFEKEKPKKTEKKTGYFGFHDSKAKRLELSWAEILKKAPEIKSVLEDYRKSLKKSYKKLKIRTEGTREVNGHKARYLYWELENEKIQGYTIVWICTQSYRLVICTSQFSIEKKSTEKPLIMEIISQIDCHPDEAFLIWSAPNLEIQSPSSKTELIKKDFLIGLTFIHLRGEDLDLRAYRIGLADQKVENPDEIPKWYKEYFKENLPGIPSKYTPSEFEKLIYQQKRITWKSIQRIEKKFPKSLTYFETFLWSNLNKNDIYCIIFAMKKPLTTKTRKLIETIIKLAIRAN